MNAASTANTIMFATYFNIGAYMDGAASQYDSIADECNAGKNEPCDDSICGSNCLVAHHKNAHTI